MPRDQKPKPGTNQSPGAQQPPDDLLRLLSEFESGVGSLRALAEQRQMLQSQLASRESQLSEKDGELREQSEQISQLRSTLQGKEHELQGLEQQLAQAREALEERRHALEQERAAHEADVQTARRETSLRSKELDAREAEMMRALEEQAQRGSALAQREEKLRSDAAQLEDTREQLSRERATLDALRSELDAREAELGKESTRLQTQLESLRVLGEQLDKRQEQLTDKQRATDARSTQLEQAQRALEHAQHAHEQAKQSLLQAATAHEQALQQHASEQQSLRSRQRELEEVRTRLDDREQELRTQATSLAQREQVLAQVEQLRKDVQARQQAADAALARAAALEAECQARSTEMLHQVQELQLHADEHEASARNLAQKLSQVEQALALAHAATETERTRSAEVTKQSRERLEQMRVQLETTFARRLESEKAAAVDAARAEASREREALRSELESKLHAALASAGPAQSEVEKLVSQALESQRTQLAHEHAQRLQQASEAATSAQLAASQAQLEQQLATEREAWQATAAKQLDAALREQRSQLELRFSQTLSQKLEEQASSLKLEQQDVDAAQHALLDKWRSERAKLEEAARKEIAQALDAQRRELEHQASEALATREAVLREQSAAKLQEALHAAREQAQSQVKQAVDEAVAQQRREHEAATSALRSQLALDASTQQTALRALWDREAQQHMQAALAEQEQRLLEHAAGERDALLAKFETRLRDELAAIDNASVLGAESAIKLQREQMQQSFDSQLQHAILAEKSRVQRELADVMQVLEEYEQLWSVERHEAARLTESHAKASQDAQEADHVVGVLRDKLREELGQRKAMAEQIEQAHTQTGELQLTVEHLRAQLAEARQASAAHRSEQFLADPAAVTRRRRRLRQMRDLAQQRQTKLREAGEALQHRYEQCELVLRNRSELAAARERIIEAERRVQRRAAGSKVGVLVLCAVGTFATVGLLSWALAKQVAPATYVATSMVSADGRGRTLSERDLTGWQTYHEQILKDPRFHQFASDRFQKAGIESLGTASAVAQFVSERIRHEERNPGELKLHLTMQGRRAAERTLDTFTASMTAFANTNQIQRVDGSVTKVASASDTGGEPIDNAQTYYALSIMGGLTALVMGVSIAVWRRLARAKTAFERDTHLSSVLDDAKWGGPETLQSFKQKPQASPAKKAA